MSTRWSGRSVLIASFVIGALAACDSSNHPQQTAEMTPANQDTVQMNNATALQQEKDSLMKNMQSLVEAMNSIDSANALAGYKPGKKQGEPIQRDEVLIRDRTLKALARLRVVEARLKASAARTKKLSSENGELNTQAAELHQMVSSLQLQLATQQQRADTLYKMVLAANSRIDSLGKSNYALAVSVDSFTRVARKGFVAMGTKDYLIQHHLVSEVGGTRFPFIVKRGTTLRPASGQIDTTLFLPMDRNATELPLKPNTEYEIVSAQDLSATDQSNAKGRIFRGSIHITDPKRFWTPSPFLILREL
jgi:hypothetical protein